MTRVAASPATERMRILAVHEDPTMVLFIKRTLEPCGWVEITGARSAPLALDRLAGLKPGVILAISIEPTGGSPTGAPTGPVIATGKLSAD